MFSKNASGIWYLTHKGYLPGGSVSKVFVMGKFMSERVLSGDLRPDT